MALAVSGCANESGPTGPPPMVNAAIVAASDHQTGLRGSQLSRPLQVQVQTNGVPTSGVAVTWTTGSGNVSPATSLTDADGIASAAWTLGSSPGPMTAAASVTGATEGPLLFSATSAPLVTIVIDSTRDHQSATVGQALWRRLRIVVLEEGVPARGWLVTWRVSSGRVIPMVPTSQGDGSIEALWVLGTTAGSATATATVPGTVTPESGSFTATASPGNAFSLAQKAGDRQTVPVGDMFDALIATVSDEFGNPADASLAEWSMVSGPPVIGYPVRTAPGEAALIPLVPDSAGVSVVRISLPGGGPHVDFTITAEPRHRIVILNTIGAGPRGFVSERNGSIPAVDTIGVGETVDWIQTPFDYDDHELVSVGAPSFAGGGVFPYGTSRVSATFTTPGSYAYWDPYTGFTGTVVVE